MSKLDAILPRGVVAVEALLDDPDDQVFRNEEWLVMGCTERRRREIQTTRRCARDALRDLGVDPVVIGRGGAGEPLWPDGLIGSMTHCEGFRGAALAYDTEFVAIGIDAEPSEPLPDEVEALVASAAERLMLGELAASEPAVPWDRLLFSVKESVYKAWYPLTGTWLGFEEVHVHVHPVERSFVATIQQADHPLQWPGRFAAGPDLLLSAVAVRRSPT